MKRIDPTLIGDIITNILSNDKVAQKGLLEARALECWREVVGVRLSEATSKITLRDGRLFVTFNSAAARSEFFLNRQYIRNEINRRVGSSVVKFISVG